MDSSPNYKNSVLRCVSGLDAVYSSLAEDEFRDEVEEKILYPLEEDLMFYCKTFCGGLYMICVHHNDTSFSDQLRVILVT
jgi:hypothetical protein